MVESKKIMARNSSYKNEQFSKMNILNELQYFE